MGTFAHGLATNELFFARQTLRARVSVGALGIHLRFQSCEPYYLVAVPRRHDGVFFMEYWIQRYVRYRTICHLRSQLFMAESGKSLIVSRRIEDGLIQRQRPSYPLRERRVIGKIIVGKWMDQAS